MNSPPGLSQEIELSNRALFVGVLAGSKSDAPKLEKGLKLLDELGIAYRVSYCSAHRDPERLKTTVAKWEEEGAIAFICAAGLAAHLPGVVASMSLKPVIGVPLDAALGGLDSLLSIVQMPPGVPVATVGVDNARNAAVLAAQIAALIDPETGERLAKFKADAREAARLDDESMNNS